MTKEERIKSLEAELTMMVKDDEEQQECIINQIKEIKELQEENKMQDHALERLRNIIKEAREYTKKHFIADDGTICKELEEGRFCEVNYSFIDELLETLDKENN